jgi:choline-glycine betaine transporter
MHCPSCGIQAPTDQPFCRSCGLSLQLVSELVVRDFPAENAQPLAAKPSESVERKLLTRVFWGLVICICGVVIGILGGKVLHQNFVTAMGALIALVGALLFLSVLRSSASVSPKLERPKDLIRSKTTKQLMPESFSGAIPSVTERTTELLTVEKVKAAERKLH